MNTNAIHCTDPQTARDNLQPGSLFVAIIKCLDDWRARARAESASAWFAAKRRRQAQSESPRDIVNALQVEEKLRLGLYHLMD